ncbi:MAG: hypothetical protein J0L52_11895 [Caulobacterales bacterium]|nr:hypothetical protein [Caulobacterales bacterium]
MRRARRLLAALGLVSAGLIAPGRYRLAETDPALDERLRRIDRLLAGACEPMGLRDVWLDGCA